MLGLKSLFDPNKKKLSQAKKVSEKVNELEPEVEKLSYEQMQAEIKEVRKELKKLVDTIPEDDKVSLRLPDRTGKGLNQIEIDIQKKLLAFMPRMYAFIREVYKREIGIRHYDVQIMAGAYLAEGWKLGEIRTGEGKTMIFNLPLFLYSLVGRGAHLVTVNDYLTKRDGEYAGHIASKLGLSVGIVAPGGTSYKYISTEELEGTKGEEVYKQVKELGVPKLANMQGLNLLETTKKEAYRTDMTFSVNNELGFDYLRDNMAWNRETLVQRELYFCIVDEADSILIDEARTPLIISSTQSDSDTERYTTFAKAVARLDEEVDYEVDHKTRSVILTDKGITRIESILNVENVWSDYSMAHHLENALKAKALFLKDDQYIVQNNEVLIVDQFTGRVMAGRRFSEGIHQAIEAKEGVPIQQESNTYATIAFQNFFKLYKWLSGASGTVMTESEEFYKIYNLDAVAIPTNKPVIRDDKPDLIYRDQEVKFKAVAQDVKLLHETGQPVLVGTTSVEKSELVSQYLDELGVPHSVLNAKYHEREAQIVSKAGELGAVTVATNMAGRGTDIPLEEGVVELGGLAVIGTERHDARRIDNQLRGRSGRQGDAGYSRFYVSLDDNIMRMMGGDFLGNTVGRIMQDDAPIEMKMISNQIETAQTRVEWANFDSRKRLVDYDEVLNQQREIFYARRRKLLDLAEKSVGLFIEESLKNDPEKGEEVKKQALLDLEAMAHEMVEDEVGFIVQSRFSGEEKLSEDELGILVAKVLELAPDPVVAAGFDLKTSGVEGLLKDELRGLTEEETRKYISKGVKNMFDSKMEEFGKDFPSVFKALILEAMGKKWMEHLETMADIRSGIGLVGYAQRNPLVEYKNTGFQVFHEMLNSIDSDVIRRIFKVNKVSSPQPMPRLQTNEDEIQDVVTGDREMMVGSSNLDKVVSDVSRQAKREQRAMQMAGSEGKGRTVIKDDKVGRNDPCPCGSGKKYKSCGLKDTEEHRMNMSKLA